MLKILGLFLLFAGLVSPAFAKPLNVVTTLSTFADLVENIGQDLVHVKCLANPKFNPHFYEPKPTDVLKLRRADLFVHGGLDLEAWRGPLVDAVGSYQFKEGGEKQLDLSFGIHLLQVPTHMLSRAEGDIHLHGNPHYWLDPKNIKRMAKLIVNKLEKMDPLNQSLYNRNYHSFVDKLDKKIQEWQGQFEEYQGRSVVGYHNEWVYLMQFLGLKMPYFLEPKPGIPPTPQHLLFLKKHLKEKKVFLIITSGYDPKSDARKLAEETGTKFIVLAQNVDALPGTASFFAMMDSNLQKLQEGLGYA